LLDGFPVIAQAGASTAAKDLGGGAPLGRATDANQDSPLHVWITC
jgi:hypothetical protein